jgi:small subunit ribosomal protein S1
MESNTPLVGRGEPEQEVLPGAEPNIAEAPEQPENTIPEASMPEAVEQVDEVDEVEISEAAATLDGIEQPENTISEASVPEAVEQVDEVEAAISEADEADEAAEHEGTMQEMLEEHGGEPRLKKGEIVEGVVAQTTPTEILIDLGLKSEGVVSGKELERMDREMLDRLKVGEKVLAYVLVPENKNGNVVLSLTRALEEQDWRKAEELRTSGEIYQGKVDGYNKGGLIVRFGRVRGFVPESQVSRDRRTRAAGADPQEKWGTMRGEDISVKVLEVDRSRNRLILSERDAAPQIREQRKERLMDELQVGDVRTGRIKSLADFGAFVDVGGADGLVHLTELSWKHVTHPREILKVGQEVEVEVISVDRDRKRIGLSIKRREEDPWVAVTRAYQIGQLVQGTITKLTKFGAFARLVDNPEIEGLIHISELAGSRVNHPRDVVKEGDVLTLRVVKIEPQQRRLGLSLKRVNSAEYMDADYKRAMEPDAPAPQQTYGDIADFEAASLRSEEERRRDRRPQKKKGKKGGGRGEFEDDYTDEF